MVKIKRIFSIAVCCVFIIASCAFSAKANGGFIDKDEASNRGAKIVSIERVKEMRGGEHIVLEGNIVERHGRDRYMFRDRSGSMVIKIDDKNWHGVKAGAKDLVRIYGKVEKRKSKTEVNVDHIERVRHSPDKAPRR